MLEDLLAAALDLFAHEFAGSLVVTLSERFDQITLARTCLCRYVERQELRIVTLSIENLSDGAVFVSDFRQQWIASRFNQQLGESLLRVQPCIDLPICGVLL